MIDSISILTTGDGSQTLFSQQFDEIYHSRNGALTESQHVFVQHGLMNVNKPHIKVFEVGFGTGLNALLCAHYAHQNNVSIDYTGVELYPVDETIASQLTFHEALDDCPIETSVLHKAPWNERVSISPNFTMLKIQHSFVDVQLEEIYDVIFFDAFAPEKQPELWDLSVFQKCYALLAVGGVLTTYCAKGYVKRNMQEAGFRVEKVPGPPGKREMLVAFK
ncbi:MAG: tRNA (5-methylaminomethyl-2-thiouridine)(34)-methyltransferase MnmD [Chitinophagales bacterium]|nr:tRNA (5-methylaminomethyl-2-thiouridine)(34)-methyltransferase MnmD [Chitinophagales bacterium]